MLTMLLISMYSVYTHDWLDDKPNACDVAASEYSSPDANSGNELGRLRQGKQGGGKFQDNQSRGNSESGDKEMKLHGHCKAIFHSPQGARKSMFKKCGKIGKRRKCVMGGEL